MRESFWKMLANLEAEPEWSEVEGDGAECERAAILALVNNRARMW